MTAKAHPPYPDHLHEKEVPDHVSNGQVPIAHSLCANGTTAQKDATVSLLPYIVNIVMSGVKGAMDAAPIAGVLGLAGGCAIGTTTFFMTFKHLTAAVYGTEQANKLGDGLFTYQADANLDPLFSKVMLGSGIVGYVSGTVVGAARGLWNAPYQEFFDTSVDQEVGMVGVCCAAEHSC